MATVADIYAFLDQKAPFTTQLAFDNAGLLFGHRDAPVTKILIALDITLPVIEEAANLGANLIVSHHPVIWNAPKSICDDSQLGEILLALAENNIAAICCHTNLDIAAGGVNDTLAERLGLCDLEQLAPVGSEDYGIGRIGTLAGGKTFDVETYAMRVKTQLKANGVRYVDGGKQVKKVAVGGGACGDMMAYAIAAGCDTFVTSDLKYNQFLDGAAQKLNLIDAGHFPTENPVCQVLLNWLQEAFFDLPVAISKVHKEVFRYL
ncbi:MAG: Nif3-like dinuclear metal center hexameric protein [Oscillospiraceae bacterium]